jgi:transposase
MTRQSVRTWRERFSKYRLDGLDDEPRCGAPRKIGEDRIEDIVTRTLETKPKDAIALEHARHG